MAELENILITSPANFSSMSNGGMVTQVHADNVSTYLKYNNNMYVLNWQKLTELETSGQDESLYLRIPSGKVDSALRKVKDGNINNSSFSISTSSISIEQTDKFYLDGGGDTYIQESADGIMDFYSDDVHMLSLDDENDEVVINEGSADINFRVEGNGNANLLFCDGGTDRVGIGINNPSYQLDIKSVTGIDANIRINTTDSGDATSDAGLIFAEADTFKWYLFNDGSDSNKLRLMDADFATRDHMAQSTNGWQGSSDERMKTNITEIDNTLNKINDIRCVTFNWKYGSDENKKHKHLGLIAQDVYESFPNISNDLVNGVDDDFKVNPPANGKPESVDGNMSIGYSRVVVILLKAVQELSSEITSLKDRVTSLES